MCVLPGVGWSFPEGFDVRSCEFPQYPYAQPRRKRSVNPQQDENFIAALEAVRSGGLGFCKAAKIYGVNNRTLWLEYKKRGYPLRPSTKSRAMVAEQHNMMRPYSTPNASLDVNCSVPKIKLPPLPPLPPPNFHPGLSQSAPPSEYCTPLFNYSTLWLNPPMDIAQSNSFLKETFLHSSIGWTLLRITQKLKNYLRLTIFN